MKLKQWLREYHQMSYTDYKNLPDQERWAMEYDFKEYNRKKQLHDSQNWRPMTPEESEYAEHIRQREKKRYETSLKIGGIDELGNYTALSHRWENG